MDSIRVTGTLVGTDSLIFLPQAHQQAMETALVRRSENTALQVHASANNLSTDRDADDPDRGASRAGACV